MAATVAEIVPWALRMPCGDAAHAEPRWGTAYTALAPATCMKQEVKGGPPAGRALASILEGRLYVCLYTSTPEAFSLWFRMTTRERQRES